MSRLLNVISLLLPFSLFSQDYNLVGGYVAEGYDVVAYFDGKAKKGSTKYLAAHNGLKFKFSSQGNLETFRATPEKFIPQYGGWCAYAMGTSGDKVNINPETFEIRDGELYLFYNAFFTNTLDKWKKEGPEELKEVADKNWERIVSKG